MSPAHLKMKKELNIYKTWIFYWYFKKIKMAFSRKIQNAYFRIARHFDMSQRTDLSQI